MILNGDEGIDRGVVELDRLYDSPFVGVAPQEPDAFFVDVDANRIFEPVDRLSSLKP